MKKTITKLWISVIAFAAVVASSCSSNKEGLSKKEQRLQLQQRLDSINNIIEQREQSCIYGPPEMMKLYAEESNRMKQESDSLTKELEKLK